VFCGQVAWPIIQQIRPLVYGLTGLRGTAWSDGLVPAVTHLILAQSTVLPYLPPLPAQCYSQLLIMLVGLPITHVSFFAEEVITDDPDASDPNGSNFEDLGQIVLTIHKARLFGPIPFYDLGEVKGGKGGLGKGGKLGQGKKKLMPHTIRYVNYWISSGLT
jgi:hypothetical protein